MNTRGVAVEVLLGVGLALAAAPAAAQGTPESRDHPLLSRMDGFQLDDFEEREFSSYEFETAEGVEVRVEGRHFYIDYGLDEGVRVPSELQILRNHTNAIEEIGGTVLFSDDANAVMKVVAEGTEVWVHVRVYNQATAYSLNIVEREAMAQEVDADAASMARDLATSGRTAVYGIYFDFDKADVKPASAPTLTEIARLLRDDPELALFVVGHTDGIGGYDYNLDLSRRRAQAVVGALVNDYGIGRERLRPAGVGPLAPAAPNATEEGRSRNRRVELVER
jgi:outer membrane protein OmpA-like peptidoglycan-associated protein